MAVHHTVVIYQHDNVYNVKQLNSIFIHLKPCQQLTFTLLDNFNRCFPSFSQCPGLRFYGKKINIISSFTACSNMHFFDQRQTIRLHEALILKPPHVPQSVIIRQSRSLLFSVQLVFCFILLVSRSYPRLSVKCFLPLGLPHLFLACPQSFV